MNYFLVVIHADGTQEKLSIPSTGLSFRVIPGDDVRIVDEDGVPINATLQPDGGNLKMLIENGQPTQAGMNQLKEDLRQSGTHVNEKTIKSLVDLDGRVKRLSKKRYVP